MEILWPPCYNKNTAFGPMGFIDKVFIDNAFMHTVSPFQITFNEFVLWIVNTSWEIDSEIGRYGILIL